MEYTYVDKSNVDDVTERSVQLALQIEELSNERQRLSELLTAFLVSTGFDTYTTPNERQLKLYPVLSRSLSQLRKDEKDDLFDWAYKNFPDLLTINHSRLLNLLLKDVIPPIQITTKGFSVRVLKEKQDKKIRPLEEITIAKPKEKIKEKTIAEMWGLNVQANKKESIDKKTVHQERIKRLADLQNMWENGETFRSMAKKHGLESGYVKRLLRPYINKKLRELRTSLANKKPESTEAHITVEI